MDKVMNNIMLAHTAVLIKANHLRVVEMVEQVKQLSQENGLMLKLGFDRIEQWRKARVAEGEDELAGAESYQQIQEFQEMAGVDDMSAIDYCRACDGGQLMFVNNEEVTAVLHARTGCYVALTDEERIMVDKFRVKSLENAKRRENRKSKRALGKGLDEIEAELPKAKKR